jgi:cyclopropane-fatty-acyl-phospholipid synthase
MFLLFQMLRKVFRRGTLMVIDPAGAAHAFGDGAAPTVKIRIHTKAFAWRLLRNPGLAVGEGYMDGDLTVENGDIYDFLDLAARNLGWSNGDHWSMRFAAFLGRLVRRVAQHNPIGTAQSNVAHHYDLNGALYDLFLDRDRQYSCAYFYSPDDSIEMAQAQKKRHIAAKLLLKPGQRVLDIGSGWGGLGLYLAGLDKLDVTGVTLSEEQHKVSQQRATDAGVSDRVRFKLLDYRNETDRFDRIVSVGMFEHVGVGHYREFFQKLAGLLADDGVAMLHTIGRANGPGSTHPWIAKYIFPGGYSPALSEVLPHIERADLYVTDVEVLRLHYAETLRQWRRRFNANRATVAKLYDERFCRMWEFYLAGSECAFRWSGHVIFQIQMAKKQDAVPLTRDYIGAFEEAHPLADMPSGPRDVSKGA